ncbi:MAG: hypothetical protein ABSB00_03045 [Minisyncoccia bacterium]
MAVLYYLGDFLHTLLVDPSYSVIFGFIGAFSKTSQFFIQVPDFLPTTVVLLFKVIYRLFPHGLKNLSNNFANLRLQFSTL